MISFRHEPQATLKNADWTLKNGLVGFRTDRSCLTERQCITPCRGGSLKTLYR